MRCAFYIALAAAVVASNSVVAATNATHLLSKTISGVVVTDSAEPRQRSLRVRHDRGEDLASLDSMDEERGGNGLKNVVKELKGRSSGVTKAVKKATETSYQAAHDLDTVLAQRLYNYVKQGLTPEKAKNRGLLKNQAQVQAYERIWNAK
ncbi:RxLR effector protein [Phytophthora megakarya]|uniref:RxLR effector protein n=1 Tax=Phytophthora megakarya TaxID=4795 RepID=A0A225W9B4_9STRA|nr:RxLR effector protein [Phytophthora megakarya]